MNRQRTLLRIPRLSVCGSSPSGLLVGLYLGIVWSLTSGCGNTTAESDLASTAESCMSCHNGSAHNDYAGDGLENPHPFPGAATLTCTQCHGGDGAAAGMVASHVPPPPEIGDEAFQETNAEAYFNRLTLTGIDKFEDYEVDGVTYTALQYLQFVNPGDLRVVIQGESCGACHQSHAECVNKGLLATEGGMFSGALYGIGVDNSVGANQTLYQDTASDLAFRAVVDPDYLFDPMAVGAIGSMVEFPVFSVRNQTGADDIFNNPAYDAANLPAHQLANGQVVTGSPLANLYTEQVAFTCGDCHLGSAGANNRYGDFRSSGCTSCHMQYALDGRSTSSDPNIKKLEPLDPDDIDEPERAHVRRHMIASVSKTLQTGETVQGIDDYACAGCHQGSNRTVMQYWGIRLDQNEDVRRNRQYPSNPDSFETTRNDTRLFDPVVENNTFNGRNHRQYLLEEDYDGDGRDDTPADVHHEAGMGCIDCHGSHDLHGGDVSSTENPIHSRMSQAVSIRCEDCHGSVDSYASTVTGFRYDGTPATLGVDSFGNTMRHVVQEDGQLFLYSRLTGNRHYVSQVRDVIANNGRVNPITGLPVYSAKASYAMGRADGDPATGVGPEQTGGIAGNFCHSDTMSCSSCHSAWTNNCVGCHLYGEYNNGANFSNITGERIVFREDEADFVYQSPVYFQLGVDSRNKISPISPNTSVFFRWRDRNGAFSQIFTFSDRNGQGADTSVTNYPSLAHNFVFQHSIRGKVSDTKEGPRYCVSCHLTDEAITNYGPQYDAFRTAMATDDFASIDQSLLQTHIGENTGNQMNSPFWVHKVAGLGSGLFWFDADGGPVNTLDNNAQRVGAGGFAPSATFNIADIRYNLDRIVNELGQSTGSSSHPILGPLSSTLRDGAANPFLSGPLGATLISRLTDPTTGIVLDSWLDADGDEKGDANIHVP